MPTFPNAFVGGSWRALIFVGAVTAVADWGTFIGAPRRSATARVQSGHLWLSGVSTLLAVLPAWLALTSPSPTTYQASFFVAELLLFLSTGPINVVIVSEVPAGMRAMAMAVSIFVIHALGDAISPPLIGLVADLRGLAQAVLMVPVAIAVSGVIWTMTAMTRSR
jgi:hypothetical protein